jgi:predicted transcriptional regulator
MEVLKNLFDEKILKIITLFIENPDKKYFLTDVSKSAKVNITTTFRILNKLAEKGFLKRKVMGKIRFYQLDYNEKTKQLADLLRKSEGNSINEFVSLVSFHPRIKKIILESKEENSAKIILVGDFLPQEKISKAVNEIKNRHNFKISYVEISENQYLKLKEFKNYNLDKKIIWERPKA